MLSTSAYSENEWITCKQPIKRNMPEPGLKLRPPSQTKVRGCLLLNYTKKYSNNQSKLLMSVFLGIF